MGIVGKIIAVILLAFVGYMIYRSINLSIEKQKECDKLGGIYIENNRGTDLCVNSDNHILKAYKY